MSKRLTSYDFTKPSTITSTDRMKYPWEEWFDGSIWRITQGDDFKTHPLMMERIIRTRATAWKAKIVIRHEAVQSVDPFGCIVFQRTDVAPAPVLVPQVPTPIRSYPAKRPVRPLSLVYTPKEETHV